MRLLAVVLVTMLACRPDRRPPARSWPSPTERSPAERSLAERVASGPLLGVPVLVVAGLAIRSPLLVVAGPIVTVGAWREQVRRQQRRGHRVRSAAMLDFTDAVVAGLRAGGSLSTAVMGALHRERTESGEPVHDRSGALSATARHPGLEQAASGLAAGRPFAAAFTDAFAADDVSSDDRLVATTVVALHVSGASAVDALERVADTLRDRHAWQEDLRTQAQQALSSAAVMSALPLVFGLAAAFADPGVGELYRSRWVGALCAGSALLLGMIGWEWQQRLLVVSR